MNTRASTAAPQINRTKFLVIDDLAGRSNLIERYLLLSSALQVRKATSPLEGLRVLQDPRTPIDCVLCSHEFKPMTGLEFLQNLRAGRYGGRTITDTKFILMLRQRDEQVLNMANSVGVNGHIVGGFDRDGLVDIVTKAMAHTPAPAPTNAVLLTDGPFASDATAGTVIRLAHIREQGVNLIIVPFEKTFGAKSPQEQHDALIVLRDTAARAQLQGEVVPVWDMGDGGMAFLAPQGFHPYFRSISLDFVRANLNREIRIV